jgi:archaellin
MRIVELILDDQEITGIEAISVVENPAIEEDFIALKNQEIKLAEVSTEKRILLGALLIPNKPIYRRKGEEEYYIYFSRDTVEKASQLYLQNGNQNKATLEHQHSINGLTLVESWIVEDETHDKSRKYGLNVPVGTWMGAVKVNNEEIWESYVRTKKIKGFSIEGYFADKMERPKEPINDFDEDEAQDMLKYIRRVVKQDGRYKDGQKEELESYSDYPSGVKNNAKRGIELNEKVNNKCATDVGKIRAQQLAQGKPISKETIKRMYSYLSRAEEYYDETDSKACGTISYLLWGGKAGKRWAESKLKELGEIDLASQVLNDEMAIIDDRLAFATKELAIAAAKDIGCESYHEHEYEGKTWYMPCEQHNLKKPCAKGFVQYGMKNKKGKLVPNCIPIDG